MRRRSYKPWRASAWRGLILRMLAGGLVGAVWALSPAWAGTSAAHAGAKQPDPELRRLLTAAINAKDDDFRNRYQAEVWMVDMSQRLAAIVVDPKERIHILRDAHREAVRAGLSPELVLSVIQVESNFDRFAISTAGARGLMQIMPFWLKEIGHPDANLFHIDTNLRLGCTILKYYLKLSHGDIYRALARYNGSNGHVEYPQRVFRALSKRWFAQ